MGLPAYFFNIIKLYPKIISKYNAEQPVSLFGIDAQSIIYNSLHTLTPPITEQALCEQVCIQLDTLMLRIPACKYFIAFDGVAPKAKQQQQLQRRLKTRATAKPDDFDTCQFTPGTPFMSLLSDKLKRHYANKTHIILSTSQESGEGEHKIFAYIRTNQFSSVLIYGLDADLIMLSLLHLRYTTIGIVRERPEFGNLDVAELTENDTNTLLHLNVQTLATGILQNMTNEGIQITNPTLRIQDYVLIMFMLGNDFLPHFPSLCMRTRGIHNLLRSYREIYGKGNRHITDGNCDILRQGLQKFIEHLARNERQMFLDEMQTRNKWAVKVMTNMSAMTDAEIQNNIPLLHRAKELYVAPAEDGWIDRYYDTFFGNDGVTISQICQNYLRGLHWCFDYYTGKNTDWHYTYNYFMPPLITDLAAEMPRYIFERVKNVPCSKREQIANVMPTEERLNNMKYEWSYCKYLWEAHIHL